MVEDGQFAYLPRRGNDLHDFPMKYRWELIRRHPYYQIFWESAKNYSQGDIGVKSLNYVAKMILAGIGVTGEPVDPKLNFDELEGYENLDPAFLTGAVQPMTLRSMAILLLNALPSAELQTLGAIFQVASNDEYSVENDTPNRFNQSQKAMAELVKLSSHAYDSIPETPLFHIHLEASLRTISDALEGQFKQWKKKKGIKERRVHPSKLPEYLKIWDLREGWNGEKYVNSKVMPLKQIAKKLKTPESTTGNQYKSAFKHIFGSNFSLKLWHRVMMPIQMSNNLVPRQVLIFGYSELSFVLASLI